MSNLKLIAAAGISAVLAAACSTVVLAPGADKVRITKVPADVAGCTAVGNIKVSRNSDGVVDAATAEKEFRNLTIGLGGNTAFATAAPFGVPTDGIAYRCP